MTNVLIIMGDGRLQTAYVSEPDVHTFGLDYDVDGPNLSPREQQRIMLGFPHDAAMGPASPRQAGRTRTLN